MKKCPFCAEEIKSEAMKCKHCGSDLNKRPTNRDLLQEKENKKHGCLYYFVIFFFAAIIMFTVCNISRTHENQIRSKPLRQFADISCQQLREKMNSNKLTDIQKDKIIEETKGKLIRWEGYVNEVKKMVVGSGYQVQVSCGGKGFLPDTVVHFTGRNKDKLLKMEKGSKIKFEGQFDHLAPLIGFSVRDAELR